MNWLHEDVVLLSENNVGKYGFYTQYGDRIPVYSVDEAHQYWRILTFSRLTGIKLYGFIY